MVRRSLLAPIAVAIAVAGARVEAPGAMVEETLPDDHPAVSSAARREGGCWDETMPGAFLEMGESTAAAMEQAADSKADWQKTYNWFYNDRLTPAGNLPNKWEAVQRLGMAGSESKPPHPEWANAFPGKGLDMSLWGPLLGQMPSFAGALFGRSLFSGCKCEGLRPRPSPKHAAAPVALTPPPRAACVYSIDTMVMHLDEDTMGMFDQADIDRILMDRFCYGIKWIYRSAVRRTPRQCPPVPRAVWARAPPTRPPTGASRAQCHHIMSNYYEDVTDMVMTYYTGWDICRQLRFCPWFLNDPLNANDPAGGETPWGKLTPT